MSNAPKLQWEEIKDEFDNIGWRTSGFDGFTWEIRTAVRRQKMTFVVWNSRGDYKESIFDGFPNGESAMRWCQAREDEALVKAHPEPKRTGIIFVDGEMVPISKWKDVLSGSGRENPWRLDMTFFVPRTNPITIGLNYSCHFFEDDKLAYSGVFLATSFSLVKETWEIQAVNFGPVIGINCPKSSDDTKPMTVDEAEIIINNHNLIMYPVRNSGNINKWNIWQPGYVETTDTYAPTIESAILECVRKIEDRK